jgi:hypothetical protein
LEIHFLLQAGPVQPLESQLTRKTSGKARDFLATAREVWTPERTLKVTAGKAYRILPGECPELLRTLGILNADATMSADAVRKYVQINHLLNLFWPALEELAGRFSPLRVVDAGCGKSYLSFVLAWALKNRMKGSFKLVGIDSNQKLIETSRVNAETLGFSDSCHFVAGDLSKIEWGGIFADQAQDDKVARPHFVAALHACDTATDDALAAAVQIKADVIAVAPCCQAELAAKWKLFDGVHAMRPVFKSPEIRREMAADMTDMLRVLLLRSRGYEVSTTEFVSQAHTPKNRLILATRRGNWLQSARDEYDALKAHFGGKTIKLEDLLEPTRPQRSQHPQ